MKKYLWVLVIIFLSILTNIANSTESALIYPNEIFSELNNETPSYTLIPIPSAIITDPGRTVNVDIYISGFGYISNNKMIVFVPSNLLNTENPGRIGASIGCMHNKTTNITVPIFSETSTNLTAVKAGLIPGMTGLIPGVKFSLIKCNFMYNNETLNEQNVPPIMLEGRNNGSAPSYIIMNLADNATPGDYEIPIVFTYTDGEKWYQDKKQITIHVNNPIEENRFWLVIALTLLGGLLTYISIEDNFKKYFSSCFGKIKICIIILLLLYIFYLILISL